MKNKEIFVVDDSIYMRTVLKNILEDEGYTIKGEAGSKKDTLEYLQNKELPDLLTLDLVLPDSEGLGLLKQIREKLPDLKIIVVSAMGQNNLIEEAMENGANAFIVKPFDEKNVLEKVKNLLVNNEEPDNYAEPGRGV